MALSELCEKLDRSLGLMVGQHLPAQPDSRAAGAHIEQAVVDSWGQTCEELAVEPQPRPGRRSIFDAALVLEGQLIGVDVRTKELDDGLYSDGGICSVNNLPRFLMMDRAILLISEIGYRVADGEINLAYVKSAPIHCLPITAFRIENLGTGQVRLDEPVAQLEVDWRRDVVAFSKEFAALAADHYEKVIGVANRRKAAMDEFTSGGSLKLR